jgi:hypothetical protein
MRTQCGPNADRRPPPVWLPTSAARAHRWREAGFCGGVETRAASSKDPRKLTGATFRSDTCSTIEGHPWCLQAAMSEAPAPIEVRRALATLDRAISDYVTNARLGIAA